jgi:hypothetical protein
MSVARLRGACFLACLAAAGCAGTGSPHEPPDGAGSADTPDGRRIAPQAAMASISVGRSTKADVSAVLGKAIVVSFDSGYDVWVYRWPGSDGTTRAATELVVLFAPSGIATKARLRPGYPPRETSD